MKKLAPSLCSAFFLFFQIFVYGPFLIYQGNTDEFLIPLRSILSTLLLPAVILFLLLSLTGLALSGKAHRFYVSILFTLGVLIWLQGNFLVWKYGLLDGQGLDWSRGVWRGWVDGISWAALLGLTCFFFKRVYRIVVPASVAITFVLAASLLITSLQKPEIWAGKEKPLQRLIPPEKIFEFSSGQNVIHFVLDAFRSDLFEEIVTEDMDRYSDALEGFTFFRETNGAFPTTYMAVPAFLSGQIYKNDVPMREFASRAIRGGTIARWLHNRGYETDLVTEAMFTRGERYSTRYLIAIPYGGTIRQYLRMTSAIMLDLVLFRDAPHFLKRYIYNDERWLVQDLLDPGARHLGIRYFSHQAFLTDLIEKLSVKREEPVYKFIHLMTTHPPVVVGKDCRYAPVSPANREDIKNQDKCCLDHFLEFLDKLRSAGLYDSSLIILQADHGLARRIDMSNQEGLSEDALSIGDASLAEIAGSAAALMAIKPPQSRGPLKVSRAQVSLTDVPATISSLLNFDKPLAGRSAFDVDENEVRERRFYFYRWRNANWQSTYFPRLDEFIIKGSLFDRSSWRWNATFYPPTRSN